MNEFTERFDPRRHSLDYAAKRLEILAHTPYPVAQPEITEERIREIIAEVVHKVLYPEQDSLVDTRRHRRVRQIDEDGTEWRGVLYPVEEHPTLDETTAPTERRIG